MTPDVNHARQLREHEESHLRSDVRSSPESMRALLADEFIEFGSSGRVFDRAAFLAALPTLATFQAAVIEIAFRPRASACGLSPGLGSPDPLGQWEEPKDRADTCSAVLLLQQPGVRVVHVGDTEDELR